MRYKSLVRSPVDICASVLLLQSFERGECRCNESCSLDHYHNRQCGIVPYGRLAGATTDNWT